MYPPDDRSSHVAVLVGTGGDVGHLIDELDGVVESSVGAGAGDQKSVESTLATDPECVVAVGGESLYRRVRDADDDVPVVAVPRDAGDEFVATVAADDRAEFVHRDGATATLLAERVRQVVEAGAVADLGWELADLAGQAVAAFDVETYELRGANDVFFDTWAVDEADLPGLTLADLRVTDVTHELRWQGREGEDEDYMEWLADGGPVETFVRNARNGDYEVREWHCEGADGGHFKSDVRVVADPTADVGYLAASVPDDGPGTGDGRGQAGDDRGPTGDGRGPTDHDEASMLQSVMEHVPMSVYFEDRLSRHVLVSEDLVEPFIEGTDGKVMHTPEDVHGKTYFDLYTEDMAVRATADNERIMETGEPLRGQEKHVQPPHGRDLWFSTNKAPWYDDEGRVQGIVGITVDITEQKRRERELDRQNERLEEFANIVSHDLRNPLNVAQGRLDLYRKTGDVAELETVAEMHDRIGDLIDEVLAFAREGSRIEDPEWVDGRSQVEAAWGAVDTAQASLDQDWAYSVRADPRRLVRLFENLFRNAVEHGGSDVTVAVGTLEDEAGFYVQDDGLGVPADVRDSLFDRGSSTDADGTGYGLAIVEEIAEAHGWDVAATESDAGGARFEVTGVPRGNSE